MFGSIKYHKRLNPKIWRQDMQIDDDVRRALIAIAMDYVAYMNYVGFDITDKDIVDIFIHGSITNFYYDKHSDIDLFIVADTSRITEQMGKLNVGIVYKALLRNWRNQFDFNIRGRRIDLSMHDVTHNPFEHGYYRVGSIYSLMKNEWIIRPQRLSDKELHDIMVAARGRVRQIHSEIKETQRTGGDVRDFLRQLQARRTDSMRAQYWQPLTPETVAFKMVRNRGIIRRLMKESAHQYATRFNVK